MTRKYFHDGGPNVCDNCVYLKRMVKHNRYCCTANRPSVSIMVPEGEEAPIGFPLGFAREWIKRCDSFEDSGNGPSKAQRVESFLRRKMNGG